MPASLKRRRWFLFAIGGLLVVVAASAVGLVVSYGLWNGQRQAQQRAAVAKVEALGGTAQPSSSSASPISIMLESRNAPNLIHLNEKGLSDDDLRFLESAPTTRSLSLFKNKITDEGLIHLSNLPSLEFLDLRRNMGITDAGLIHLEKLRNLKHLYLMGTGVTPAGAMKLQAKLPNTKIGY